MDEYINKLEAMKNYKGLNTINCRDKIVEKLYIKLKNNDFDLR